MFTVINDHVFPFLRTLGGDGSTYAHHMKDARFTIPTPALLAKVVDMIDGVPMEDCDTMGDLYESPYTNLNPQGPDGVFTSQQIDELISILAGVRSRAIAYLRLKRRCNPDIRSYPFS